ncbi:MAG: DUF4829 domain-containing protein [Firmicutes bacterium]|nr:DUF4829 domain-containing protein [Bacillota bacterium]
MLGGTSVKFSAAEIRAAEDVVLRKFNQSYEGCTLLKLWYDEGYSDEDIENALSSGAASYYADRGITKVNMIVLLSNFHVDSVGPNDGWEGPGNVNGWMWVLIRDSKTGAWRVDNWGLK